MARPRFVILRVLILVITLLNLTPSALAEAPAQAAPTPTARTDGNSGVLGSREQGFMITWTVTGMSLPAPSYEGYGRHNSSGVLIAPNVTVQATLYVAIGAGLVTRPVLGANIGADGNCGADKPAVDWPPVNLLDQNGVMGGPMQHEEAVTLTWQLQPGQDKVCFDLRAGINGGQFEGASFHGYAPVGEALLATPTAAPTTAPIAPLPQTPEATAQPSATPAPGPSPKPTTPPGPGPRPPCPEPLFFYQDQDLTGFYTGEPSLNYSREQFISDLVAGMDRFKREGQSVSDGTKTLDVARIGHALVSGALPTGKEVDLQDAARKLAKDQGKPLTPGDLLYLSLQINDGNVRDALVTCHAALYRDAKKDNARFIAKKGVLTKIRNAEGYGKGQFTYKTVFTREDGSPVTRKVTMQSIAKDEQGVWYHLFGMAALEFTDKDPRQNYQAAHHAIMSGFGLPQDAVDKIREKGYPVTGLGGRLADLANALEEAIRSRAGKPPDPDKNCVNYAGIAAGRALKQRLNLPPGVEPPPEPQETDLGDPMAAGFDPTFISWPESDTPRLGLATHSPLSVRITGADGEVVAFDQRTRQWELNTPWVYYEAVEEENGTWGVIVLPVFEVANVEIEATGQGPAAVAIYAPDIRRAAVYEFAAQPGDAMTLPDARKAPLLNGRRLKASETSWELRLLDWVIVIGAGLVLIGILALVLVLRARRRRGAAQPARAPKSAKVERKTKQVAAPPTQAPPPMPLMPSASPPQAAWPSASATSPSTAPVAVAPSATPPPTGQGQLCVQCGAPLDTGSRFCGKCGARQPEPPPPAPKCAQCGAQLDAGARFCGVCGATVAAAGLAKVQAPAGAPLASPVVATVSETVSAVRPALEDLPPTPPDEGALPPAPLKDDALPPAPPDEDLPPAPPDEGDALPPAPPDEDVVVPPPPEL